MYNDKIKQAIYKWRENHIDEYRIFASRKAKLFYDKNKETIRLKKRGYYLYKTECQRLRNILL